MSPLPPALLSTYSFFKTQRLCPPSRPVYRMHCISRQRQTAVSIVLVRGLFLKNRVQLEMVIYKGRGIPELLGLCTQHSLTCVIGYWFNPPWPHWTPLPLLQKEVISAHPPQPPGCPAQLRPALRLSSFSRCWRGRWRSQDEMRWLKTFSKQERT